MLQEYSVSRESLREGLRLLEVQGLLTIRRGPSGGPSVGTVDPANLGRISTIYYRMAGATYRELHEAWVQSEATLAERAARNPDAEARAEARARYLDHLLDPDSDLTDYLLAQTGFHAAIASLARNRVLELSLQAVGSIVSHHFFVEEDPRQLGAMIDDDHSSIARAIAAGRAKVARELMGEHIENVARTSEIFVERFDEYVDWIRACRTGHARATDRSAGAESAIIPHEKLLTRARVWDQTVPADVMGVTRYVEREKST